MALIKCTECGKTFSDKAATCPECGCPTELVLKETNSAEVIAKKKETSQQATDSILAEVKKAKSKASSAESLFNSRNRSIQIKASSSIDLFGGYATSRVVEIQSDVREACDDLYTTYQALVETLDGMCRPLLDFSPCGEAIKAVADAIRYFNEESEIESNFTASFNGSNLGNVANSKYVPSISNKMIQKFWESKYAESPYAIEYEKNRIIEAEKVRKRREEERLRAEAERKKKAEEKKKEDARKAAELEAAKKHKESIVAETKKLIKAFEKEMDLEITIQLSTLKRKIDDQIAILTAKKKEYESALLSMGLFSFSEKKKTREQIELTDKKISKLMSPQILDDEKKNMKVVASKAVDAYKEEIESYLAKRFPNSNKKAKKKTADALGEYYESTEFANATYPVAPKTNSIFAEKQ